MKQKQIIEAYKTIQKYEKEQMPLNVSYKFFKIKKLLSEQWEFQLEKEQEIFDRYKPEFKDNVFTFVDEEEKNKFAKEIKELSELEIDLDFDKIKIDFQDLKLSVDDVEALDPFVNFE